MTTEEPTTSDVWRGISDQDIEDCAAKLSEYGAHDLLLMGESLIGDHPKIKTLKVNDPAQAEVLLQEAAIAFYATGKAARLMAAYKRGDLGSEDSWKDLDTYGQMARVLRVRGTLEG